jgi:endonuclease G
MNMADTHNINVPLPSGGSIQININIGVSSGASKETFEPRPRETAVVPSAQAEAKRLDKDYSNRNGFSDRFVPGVRVGLKKLLSKVRSRIAPLVDGDTGGELQYQNFSVVMDKDRHFAILTATNIDGEAYLAVDRKSGRVVDAEGETWYKDPRISAEYYVGQDFYGGWSHKFDRGHLTRRNDPTWGDTEADAERANADTFHFTNCTPQHFRFNQSVEYWQGLERYVLERGLLQPGRAKRLTVLQGPVFDDQDLWADDVQIPSQFWKIVVWNGAAGLRAVGLMGKQSDLFDEDRGYIRRPDENQTVEVSEFHVSLPVIAKHTGLDLSDLSPYDTRAQGLPQGGEAVSRITKWTDIKL